MNLVQKVGQIGKIFLSTSISQGLPAVCNSGTEGEYRKKTPNHC